MVIIGLIAGVVALSGGNRGNNSPKASGDGSVNGSGSEKVRLETNMGDVVIELRDDVPNTTSNFVGLVQQGVYNDTIFHRVVNIPNNLVIIQGGDPTGTGYGDPSIPSIPDELSDNPENNENRRGTMPWQMLVQTREVASSSLTENTITTWIIFIQFLEM
jgi:hypothetical protein